MAQSNLARAGIVALAVGAVAAVAFFLIEVSDSGTGEKPTPTSTKNPFEPEKTALPQEATTLAGLAQLAWTQARNWRSDAHLARIYASAVHPDGTFDRARADVQFVFLSKELSLSGPTVASANGFRWALSQGKTYGVELKQYPAPQLHKAEPQLCDLLKLAGDNPPAEVVLDVHFVEHEGKPPSLALFTDDQKFMVVADPDTCVEQGRASRRTADELDGGPVVPLGDAGRVFDFPKANSQVLEILGGISSCKRPGGPTGQGTVSLRFDQQGKVEEVSFQSGGYAGTPVGQCIEDRLRKVSVRPWDSGRGFIIKRFTL